MSKPPRVITYPSDAVSVVWDQQLCIHAAECGRARNELFVTGRDPWCDPSLVDAGTVREVVARCPSGALSVKADAVADAPPPAAPERNLGTVASDGPLFLSGRLSIEGAPDRAPALAERAALCRCGLSSNKPFCDNSHREGGWRDHGAIGETGDAPGHAPGEAGEADGTLRIDVAKHGPLRVSGHLTLFSGAGREAWHGSKTALCRCGLSARKPFCDGSHRQQGWSDEA